jgi:hypothetical protein
MGRIFVTTVPQTKLYRLDPSQPAGAVTTVATNIGHPATSAAFDGSRIWTGNLGSVSIVTPGATLPWSVSTVTAGFSQPGGVLFDGSNIWVTSADSVSVVRASSGVVLATLTGDGLDEPNASAFDGQRVLVTNGADSVSVWKAADLTTVGSFSTGANTYALGACSDGFNFWITLQSVDKLARF